MKPTSCDSSSWDGQHTRETTVRPWARGLCTGFVFHIDSICILFIGIYTLRIEKGNSVIYREKAFLQFEDVS